MPSKLPLTDQLFYRSRWKQNWLSIDVGDVLEFTMDELFDEGELEMMDPLGVEFKNYNPKTHQDMLQHQKYKLDCPLAVGSETVYSDQKLPSEAYSQSVLHFL